MPLDTATSLTHDELAAHIGARIAHRRRQLGLTQSDLAAEISMSRENVSRIETGQRVRITAITLQAVARALRVAPAWLLDTGPLEARHERIGAGEQRLIARLAGLDPATRRTLKTLITLAERTAQS